MKKKSESKENTLVKPDPETIGKTDPQDDMQGPLSSIANKGGKIMETKENNEDATKRHEKNM